MPSLIDTDPFLATHPTAAERAAIEVSLLQAKAEIEALQAAGTGIASVSADPAPALGGTFSLNARTIVPGAPITTGAKTYAAGDSGKTFVVTTAGTQTIPAGLGAGWTVDIWNDTVSNVTIAGATNATLAAGQVATVKFLTATKVRVALGDTAVIRT